MAVKPIPDGYHTVTPYITVDGANRLIDFAVRAFDAQLVHKTPAPGDRVMHAEIRVGDSMIMISDSTEQWPVANANLYLYVPDVDASFRRAVEAGATVIMDVATHFYGDRSGGVKDAFGNTWWIATHVEDVSPEELQRRMAEL